jgi:hypothetical protein
MQQIDNKKVIHRRTSEIICNTRTFDYMRITFPFEALTKLVFLEFVFSIYLAKI